MTEIHVGGSSLERLLWRLVLVLLVIGGVLMAWSVMGHRLTPAQARLLVSSFGVAIYGSMALACTATLARQPTSLGARAGIAVAFAAGALLLLGVWTNAIESMTWWKAFASSTILAFTTSLGSLFLWPRLDERFVPVRALTRASLYAWAGLLIGMILFQRNEPLLWRLVGLTSTIWMFGGASLPVLAKLSKR